MTIIDDREELPDAEPLPAEPSPPNTEPDGDQHDQEHEPDGPPPLPPLLETGASTLATTGAGIYAVTGVAGLVAAAGVATVAGVAYGIHRHQNKKNTAAGNKARASDRNRFFGAPGLGGGRAGRSARSGAMAGRSGRSNGRGAGSGLAGGRHRASRTASGGLTGAGGRTARGTGHGVLGSSGSAGRGGGRFGPDGSRSVGRSSGAGGGLLGSAGSSRSGRSTTSRGTGGGLFGGSAGSRSTGSSRRSRGSSGGLFGGVAGHSARRSRGRTTAITDPATPVSSERGRIRRAVRRGWEHPRTQRARVRARKSWHKSRVRARRTAGRARTRIRSHTKRLGDYLHKRKWALRARGWGRSFADWWRGVWDTLRGRASDPRYGRLKGWQLTAAAAAIGALGAGKKKADPRPPLVGRIIGTAAPVPGDGRPITMPGRRVLALTSGEGEPLATEAQRVKDAADELRAALAGLGGSQVGMLTYEQGLRQLGPILGAVADGFRDMATTAEDEQPLDPAVLEFFGTIEGAARGAAEVADEMPGLFRAAHEVELERLENPRRNEHKWDISQQH